MVAFKVRKAPTRFFPDSRRLITKRFEPVDAETHDTRPRTERALARILALSEQDVQVTISEVLEGYSSRHADLRAVLEESFRHVAVLIDDVDALSFERRLLIGAYFVHEYSIEAAALCNPSLVAAPDQSGLDAGEMRVVLSLRAIGEGHISSIEFRSGIVDEDGNVALEAPARHATTASRRPTIYEKGLFRGKLTEMRVYNEIAAAVLDPLSERFTMQDLEEAIERVDRHMGTTSDVSRETRALHWLAASNYESSFGKQTQLSERVLFPAGPAESSGMEDARFVKFVDEDGTCTYFATYTAYDGYQILPQLIETTDFVTFRIATLNGASARNKGIALFPRKIGGRYAALARIDGENNFYMTSENVRFWHDSEIIHKPRLPWELSYVGNCGSPIETDEGWLVITHGVGPMRRYALGALLLDLEDPRRVIGQLQDPLFEPRESERDGYVPNVVYSCGSIVVGSRLIVPYGFSDSGTGFITLSLNDLLTSLVASSPLH
jgi:predicted GH43/DUF377 family glycosyl hydrolase